MEDFTKQDLSHLSQQGREVTGSENHNTHNNSHPTPGNVVHDARNGAQQTHSENQHVGHAPHHNMQAHHNMSTQQPDQQQSRPVVKDDEFLIERTQDGGLAIYGAQPENNPQDYSGPGVVIRPEDGPQNEQPKFVGPGVNPDTASHLDKYMQEMDETIQHQKEKARENGYEGEEPPSEEDIQRARGVNGETESVDPEREAIDSEKKFEEVAVVTIDKIGMGRVINFTEEEHAKLEKVNKIRVEEVETVRLASIKTKKATNKNVNTIIKRKPVLFTTPIILPGSYYTAIMKGISPYELLALMNRSEDMVEDTQTKWSTIYDKIHSTSIGYMTFNEFLKKTVATDYNNFIYGLLCSTYPDNDKIPLKCQNPKCNHEYDFQYEVRKLLRVEKMNDDLKKRVAQIVDASHTEESAKRLQQQSLAESTDVFELPISKYVVELYSQSVHDLINTSIKGLETNDDKRYNTAAVLSTSVRAMYVEDPEEPDTYIEYNEPLDITKLIYSLMTKDLMILTRKIEKLVDDCNFEYGLMNVTCPKCKRYEKTVEFNIETILFYRYQQEMSTQIV